MPGKYKPQLKRLPSRFEPGVIAKIDGRSDVAKRLSATFNGLAEDAGGVDNLPYGRLVLCERAAFLEEFLRQLEQELIADAPNKAEMLGKWTQGVNSLQGLVKTIGLPRSRAGGPQDWIDGLYEPDDDEPEDAPEKPPGTPSEPRKGKAR